MAHIFSVNPVNIYVGGRLFLARQAKGISQQELAELENMTVEELQKIERGEVSIPAHHIVQLANRLNVTVGWLFETCPSNLNDFITVESDVDYRPEVRELLQVYFGIENPNDRFYLREIMSRMMTPKH